MTSSWSWFALLVTGILLQLHTETVSAADTFVTIKNGTLKGKTANSAHLGGLIYAYTRIPYAKPPVGNLRFRAPEPAVGWGDEILDATQKSTGCPQHLTSANPSEDCLFLNVYSKVPGNETAPKELLPVMVFIFGGGFVFGDNNYYTGTKLLANNAVLVVPNYRVGFFGFLATGDEASPGNYGLKDQRMVLRWVQENIEAFGGDPNQVTLFGESAGAASAMYHLISPESHGLFNKMIAQSGTPLTAWARDTRPLEHAQEFAGLVGCPTNNTQTMVDCLRSKPAEELSFAHFNELLSTIGRMEIELPGSPAIEPVHPGAFFTENPLKLLLEGPLPDIPIIMGTVQTEGSFVMGGFYYWVLGKDGILDDPVYVREELIPGLLTSFKVDEPALVETLALAFMPGSTRDNFTEIMPDLNDMLSVFFNKGQMLRTADILSRRLSSVYLYSFEQQSKNSLWNVLWPFVVSILGGEKPKVDGGIMHADDLIYMFNFPVIPTPQDTAFSKIFNKMWVDFATTGNPTPSAENGTILWPKYNTETQLYYRLSDNPAVLSDYRTSWRRPYV